MHWRKYCVVKAVRQKLVRQTGSCGFFSLCASVFLLCVPPLNDDGYMGFSSVGVSLWMCSWMCWHCCCVCVCECERVCSLVCATSVLDQQSCCYPINSVAAGHAGATQRTLGNSRAQWSHFHSTASLLVVHCCTILCVQEEEKAIGWTLLISSFKPGTG